MGCTLYDGGGVKEVFGKHLLPFNPFIHRHFRYVEGGEEVFSDEILFFHHFFLSFLKRTKRFFTTPQPLLWPMRGFNHS